MPHQRDRQRDAGCGRERDRCREPRERRSAPTADEQKRGDGAGKQRKTGHVDTVNAVSGRDPRGDAPHQCEREHAQRQVDPKAPAPVEADEETAERRSRRRCDREHEAHDRLVAPALVRRDDVADHRLRHHGQTAGADPLQRPRDHELEHVLRERAQQRRRNEDHDRKRDHRRAAVDVAELPVDERHRGRGEQVCGDDPRQLAEAVQIARDRRQRGRYDRLIERREHQREEAAAQGREQRAMVGHAVSLSRASLRTLASHGSFGRGYPSSSTQSVRMRRRFPITLAAAVATLLVLAPAARLRRRQREPLLSRQASAPTRVRTSTRRSPESSTARR